MKATPRVLVLLVAVGMSVAANASAQVNLDERVTISMNSVPASQLLRMVMTGNRIEATIDPHLQRPVSITLEDVRLRTVLDAICESAGCRWQVEGDRLSFLALPPDPSRGTTWLMQAGLAGAAMPAGSQFVNSPVSSVLEAIGRTVGAGCTYEVTEVAGSQFVSVDVSNQDALRAIASVVKATGLRPGSPYTIVVRRAGEKPTIIHAILAKGFIRSRL